VIIQVQEGKNIMENILFNEGSSVNIVTKELKFILLPPKIQTPGMGNHNMKLVRLIKDLKIYIHSIFYTITFIIMQHSLLDASYSMLLGRCLLQYAKVSLDLGKNLITTENYGTLWTIAFKITLHWKTSFDQ
jgi:hypothetical protein